MRARRRLAHQFPFTGMMREGQLEGRDRLRPHIRQATMMCLCLCMKQDLKTTTNTTGDGVYDKQSPDCEW
jgi:hypothetical protein